MSFYDAIRVGASGAEDFEIERSLRFNDNDSPLLTRTFGSAGNRKTWTLSCWLKRSNIDTYQGLLAVGTVDGSEDFLGIDTSNRLNYRFNVGSDLKTLALFRDVGAWYHIVVVLDTTQSQSSASASDSRLRFYINGVRQTEWDESDMPSQNFETRINNNVLHYIGEYPRISSHLDGYLAEFNFIDGQAYDPTYFAETNAVTGQWIPKKYAGSYGTTGFRLQFADNSGTTATTLGKDTSGQGNNWTPSGFSVAAGAGNDSLEDTPTNNFATLNPLKTFGTYALTNGNLTVSGSARFDSVATFAVSSGKWFWEITNTDVGVAYNGILNINQFRAAPGQIGSGGVYTQYVYDGTKYRDANPSGASSYGASYTDGDIVGVALNLDDNEITFYKNGASQGAITIPNDLYTAYLYSDSGSYNYSINFGQRPFTYTQPTGFKALNSANLPDPTIKLPNKHFDTFLYSATGNAMSFTDLNFQPDWIWQKRRDNVGSSHFHYLFDSVRGGDVGLQSNTTGAEFTATSPNITFTSNGYDMRASTGGQGNASGGSYVSWNWDAGETDGATYTVKVVSDSGNKYRFNDFGTSAVTLDLAEGGTYTFDGSDSSMSGHPFVIGTAANGSVYSTGVTYQLDGVSVTYSAYTSGYASASTRKLIITVPVSAPVLYYWCSIHSGMGGQINTNTTLGSSNFDGSIQSTVKVNASAGFSIVSYVGNNATGATVGHGLNAAPQTYIVKDRDTAGYNWHVFHASLGATKELKLNTTAAAATQAFWNNTAPTSSVFTVNGGGWEVNTDTKKHIAYVFSEVAGYSKFGSYTGNGNADGTFVFTGFRPAWVLIKNSGASGFDWVLQDSARSPSNLADNKLNPNTSSAEQTDYDKLDILSNGFKSRVSDPGINASGASYIYLAFAEAPFRNARAR